jgi:DNA adenine methylase
LGYFIGYSYEMLHLIFMKKPFITYNGGKAGNGTYQNIINHIPKCDLFIDAMVGNGGIFFNLNLPCFTVINDYDRSVIDKYNYVGHSNIISENLDVLDLIDKYDYTDKLKCIYIDPPYLMETRKSKRALYQYEWSENQHVQLLAKAINIKSNCIISHYPCDLYNSALKDWNTFDFQSNTRNGMATERIYMNYPKPMVLQDYRYLGYNSLDRQRIKRKTIRFVNKLELLPESERVGILSAIIAKYDFTAVQLLSSTTAV